MKVNALLAAILAVGLIGTVDTSYAAFGGARASSSSVGVSRSYSRPATSSSSNYSKPASTYSAPSSSSSSSSSSSYSRPSSSYSQPQTSYSRPSSSYSQPAYNNSNSYNSGSYQQPQRNSAMRDIGVTAAGVGAGILGAQAISHMFSSPSHPGMYTHPQYPGQYFNAQGVPQGAPTDQALQDLNYQQQQVQQPQAYYAPQPAVQPTESKGGFFSFIWGALWAVIKLAFWLAIVAALAYGAFRGYRIFKAKYKEEVSNSKFDVTSEKANLNRDAMDLFYDFQKNSDNEVWVAANTKYLPVKEVLSPSSEVLAYWHALKDCSIENGKLRATIEYIATLRNTGGEEQIHQFWNFEKDGEVWKVIGVGAV